MRDYLNLVVFAYCMICWAVFIFYAYENSESHRKKFGYLWFPTIVVGVVFSPGLLLVEIVVGIVKWLLK